MNNPAPRKVSRKQLVEYLAVAQTEARAQVAMFERMAAKSEDPIWRDSLQSAIGSRGALAELSLAFDLSEEVAAKIYQNRKAAIG